MQVRITRKFLLGEHDSGLVDDAGRDLGSSDVNCSNRETFPADCEHAN